MSRKQLNLGILAHVDAGKTTLTERLLYDAGAIDEIGSVDAGTTQTDSLALERRRGITIRSAVASFALGDLHVNLIDTPGHPDFIAEVERVLGVLDGAILVVSAVEGVQPQTRVLMRALQRLEIPTLLFANKIDRVGADAAATVAAIRGRLTQTVAVIDGRPADLVELLAEHDDALFAAYVESRALPDERLRAALADQTARGLVHPLFFGSAMTGGGLDVLRRGIAELLPAAAGDPSGPPTGIVFKIERSPAGERIAYVRLFSGTLHVRDRVALADGTEQKVTAIAVFERGGPRREPAVTAGGVARISGLHGARIGDRIGSVPESSQAHQFPPPTLEAVVTVNEADRPRLRIALTQLAEQDPLIGVRQDEERRELSVSLYGEVQREVIEETLALEYGLDVSFREVTPIYVERPLGTGEAIEVLHAATNPFNATLAFRIEPAPPGSGVAVELAFDPRNVPLFIYKTLERFEQQASAYVLEALREGLYGWEVVDCMVTMTECLYSVADGPPSRRGDDSTAADFRKLTPIVVTQALAAARSVVCEPVVDVLLEVPTRSTGAVLAAAGRLGAVPEASASHAEFSTVAAVLSVAAAQSLTRDLARLTGGEGTIEATFAGYRQLAESEPPPRRRR